MRKYSEDLAVGDVLKVWFNCFGKATILKFEEYNGPLDFVSKIAVFSDGNRMSIEKKRMYEIAEDMA